MHDGEDAEEKNQVKDAAGNLVGEASLENGPVGASRPNLGLVGNTAIVAYEETKGAGQRGVVSGKFVRYHQEDELLPPEVPGCALAVLALYAPQEWSGMFLPWNNEPVQSLVRQFACGSGAQR